MAPRPTRSNARPVLTTDLAPLAQLWHDGWHEAHAAFVPADLVALRTLDSFLQRLIEATENIRVVGPPGGPLGFCATKGAEIYQLYTAPAARGTGIAAELITDGEARLRAQGHTQIELAVLPQNQRAIRFYTRLGWSADQLVSYDVDTAQGLFPLSVLMMHKTLKAQK